MPARAEVIERVMAVVDGALVLQSDVSAAVRFGLVTPQAAEGADGVLERLIDRRLILAEVNRYAPPEPDALLVQRRLEEVRARFDSEQAFTSAMAEVGLTREQLTLHIRDDLRIESYVRQRFGAVVQPSEVEILEYYRQHQEMFTRGGTLRPYAEVHDEARNALVEERRAATVRDWVAGLRRRATISVPGIVPAR